MLLKLLFFVGACISSTLAQAEEEYLNSEILPKCFEQPAAFNGKLYVSGQTEPLANSLENFLSLVEKLELANPQMGLQDELFILLKNYTADNVFYQPSEMAPPYYGMLGIWKPSPATMDTFEKLWEPDKMKMFPSHVDPFEKNEKCSLFFMLSHTVNDTSRPNIDQKSYSPSADEINFSPSLKTHFPREQGVVSINNSRTDAVALGRVLLGLYVGLKPKDERIKSVDSYGAAIKKEKVVGINDVDILYLVTLADQLVISQYPLSPESKAKAGLGRDGKWKSMEETASEDSVICPTIYELPENNTAAFTFSSVRGGVDGLILGDVIGSIHEAQSDVRLTQILRMYYGRNGLQDRTNVPPSPGISFCSRTDNVIPKEEILKNQMRVFLAFISKLPNDENIYSTSYQQYVNRKEEILNVDWEFKDKCAKLRESKGIPQCEAAIDVIFVMDTTVKNVQSDLEKQKKIIGHLANHLEMVDGGTTLTAFSDQRNGTSGLGLVTVVNKTSSSACAACSAIHSVIDRNIDQAEKDFVIHSINEVLRDMKEEEKTMNGAKGKVVIFFNFEEEEGVSARLQRALRDLYLQHASVQFYAIGNTKDVLKTYAQGQLQNVIIALDLRPHEIAETLKRKICEVPSQLQYENCRTGINEAGAIYEDLISPNSIQRWAMYPKYFHKSFTPKFFFSTDSTGLSQRQIQVCHSRAYSRAEDQKLHCRTTSSTDRYLEFNTTNPCKAFNEHNCAPWYFTVSVVEETPDQGQQYCQDTNTLRCKTLDQLKFKVTHEGIRCSSGCRMFSIRDSFLACLAAYVVVKLWNVNM